MPIRTIPLTSNPSLLTGTLKNTDGNIYTWTALGGWETLRDVRREGLEFCLNGNEEDAVRFKVQYVEGGDWDELDDDIEIPDCVDDLIEEFLQWDEDQGLVDHKGKGLFFNVMEWYGYYWTEECHTPINWPGYP